MAHGSKRDKETSFFFALNKLEVSDLLVIYSCLGEISILEISISKGKKEKIPWTCFKLHWTSFSVTATGKHDWKIMRNLFNKPSQWLTCRRLCAGFQLPLINQSTNHPTLNTPNHCTSASRSQAFDWNLYFQLFCLLISSYFKSIKYIKLFYNSKVIYSYIILISEEIGCTSAFLYSRLVWTVSKN